MVTFLKIIIFECFDYTIIVNNVDMGLTFLKKSWSGPLPPKKSFICDIWQEYNDLVKNELMSERGQINFLTADGVKFAHPLHHLGKSKEDLPLIAVDSFRHMYLFPKYQDSKIEVNKN